MKYSSYFSPLCTKEAACCEASGTAEMEVLSKILILAWHVAELPCADFFYPEGQKGVKAIAGIVIEKPFLNPFVAKNLKLCNDVESNPGPGGSPRKPRYIIDRD